LNNTQNLIDNVRSWGTERGFIGQAGTVSVDNVLDELDETLTKLDNAVMDEEHGLVEEKIGHLALCLILMSAKVGTPFEVCLARAFRLVKFYPDELDTASAPIEDADTISARSLKMADASARALGLPKVRQNEPEKETT